MAEYNPYAILAAGMPAALQGLQTLAGGAMDVARYNRAQADNERVRKDMQAERLAEIDRMDQRQTRREDAIHQRNRAEVKQDSLDAMKTAYASAGGYLPDADQMTREQLAAATGELTRKNEIQKMLDWTDAKTRSTAQGLNIPGWDKRGIGELHDLIAKAEAKRRVDAAIAEDEGFRQYVLSDPGAQKMIKSGSGAIALANVQRAKALNPAGLGKLKEDQQKRLNAALAGSPEIQAAVRKLSKDDGEYAARMHAVAVGNQNAATAGWGEKELNVVNPALRAATENAMVMFEKGNNAELANYFRQWNTNIKSADLNLANTHRAIKDTFGHGDVGRIIMQEISSSPEALQALAGGGQQEGQAPEPAPLLPQPPAESTPVPLSSGAVFNPGGLAPIQAAPTAPAGVGGLNLLNAPGGWNPTGDPNVPPPNPLPGAGYYDGYPARQERGVSFE